MMRIPLGIFGASFELNLLETAQLINFIAESFEESITIPEKYDYFSYIVLDLLSQKEGPIKCEICNKTYQPDQLKPTVVGHGCHLRFKMNPLFSGVWTHPNYFHVISAGYIDIL